MDYLVILFFLFITLGVKPAIEVKATVYHIRGLTASGEHTDKIKKPFIAVSRDLLDDFPLHSKVRLSDCQHKGEYLVKDKMHKRHFKKVDVFKKYTGKKYNTCTCKLQIISLPKNYNRKQPLELDPIDSLDNADTIKIDTTVSKEN